MYYRANRLTLKLLYVLGHSLYVHVLTLFYITIDLYVQVYARKCYSASLVFQVPTRVSDDTRPRLNRGT